MRHAGYCWPRSALDSVKVGARSSRRAPDDLFADCLHRYVITDAIRDDNVLEFSVEYWGKLKRKDGTMPTDEEVAGLNLREFYDHPDRI